VLCLPVFLIADLKDEYRFDLKFTFTRLTDYTLLQFSLLNDNQKQAVGDYLRYKDANGLIRDKKLSQKPLNLGANLSRI